MVISEKTSKLLDLVLNSESPLTTFNMSCKLGISQRSIQTYLKEIREIIKNTDCQLVNRPGVGIYIDATAEQKADLLNKTNIDIDYSFSFRARKKHILDVLVRNTTSYTIQLLADDLYVSKSIIIKDLKKIEKWLKDYDIGVIRKKNFGIAIVGEEKNIRAALLSQSEIHSKKAEGKNLERLETLDYRLHMSNYRYLCSVYPNIDILCLQEILKKLDVIMGCSIADESFIYLMEFTALMLSRIKIRRYISKGAVAVDDIAGRAEYDAAVTICRVISEKMGLEIAEVEIEYLAVCLISLDMQLTQNEQEVLFNSCEENIKEIAKEIIAVVGDMVNISLIENLALYKNLSVFLQKISFRHRYNIEIKNQIHNELKRSFSGVLGVCFSATIMFEKKLNYSLSDNDVASIAILICNALAELKKQLTATLIAAGNYHTVKYIANKIERLLPELYIKNIVPYAALSGLGKWEIQPIDTDIVISVEPLITLKDVVCVSRMVTEEDIKRIKKQVADVNAKYEEEFQRSVTSLKSIPGKIAVVDCICKTKDDAIEKGCKTLAELGNVSTGFFEDVLHRESVAPTAIGNGIAVPHGFSGYVKKSSMCLIRLKKPIEWTEEDRVDLVFVLALRFTESARIREFFSNFYNIINDNVLLKKIREASHPEEIEEYFFKQNTGVS